jgi:diketogulonate reductase-like aldo/keto reductase
VTSDQHVLQLADGNKLPMLGLGVWQIPNGAGCVDAVRWALELGYRHIDTAQAYGNEQSVGEALRAGGLAREDVFLTAKFYPRSESAFEYRRALREECDRRKIALESYSTLGTGRHLSDPIVQQVAGDVGRPPSQVLLRWCVQHGIPVIPKSTHRERIEENSQIFDFTLSDEQMAQLDALDETGGTARAREQKWW